MKKHLKNSLYIGALTLGLFGINNVISSPKIYAKTVSIQKVTSNGFSKNEKMLANKKFNVVMKIAKKHPANSKDIMKADKGLGKKFNKKNYESEYLKALNNPQLIKGSQGASAGSTTGIIDGLNDYAQYQAMLATKMFAKKYHLSSNWLKKNLNQKDQKTFTYWYFNGFNDNLGGDDSNDAKHYGGKSGLSAYKQGLKKSETVKKQKASKGLINYTSKHLNNTIFNSEDFQ